MATNLTADEMAQLEEFLKPSRIAVVATIGKTGIPQLTPNWYVFQDGRLAISITKERVKYRNLSRDSRLAICIYSEPRAAEYATVVGVAEVIDDESIWPVTRAIVERYVATDAVEQRMHMLRTQYRVIVSLVPEHVVFRAVASTA